MITTPFRPERPVLPERWTYASASSERWYINTCVTPEKSKPENNTHYRGDFPEDFQQLFDWRNGLNQPVSDTQAYRQFGNSVAVPLVCDVAKLIVKKMKSVGAL